MIVFRVKDETISIIGAGSIGSEVIDALVKNGHKKLIATRRTAEKLSDLHQRYGIEVTTDNDYAARHSDIIVVSVKPYDVATVCKDIRRWAGGKFVISVAAKPLIPDLQRMLGESRICRVMTGFSVPDEIAAYTFGTKKTQADEAAVKYIFGSSALEVTELGLAARTFIACDTGLMAKDIEYKISLLEGLTEEQGRLFYAGALEADARRLRKGMTGDQIYDRVAGENSFTEKLHAFLTENKVYEVIAECVRRTIEACRK